MVIVGEREGVRIHRMGECSVCLVKRCIKIYTKLSAVCKYYMVALRKGIEESVGERWSAKGLHFILSIDLKALPGCSSCCCSP